MKFKINLPVLVVILILIVWSFLLRFWGLGANYSFWIDETSSAGFARAILDRGLPVLNTGLAGPSYFTHFYLTAFAFKILGFSEMAARLPSVIFGTLAIPLVYFLGREFANKKVGLVSTILFTFSVWEITWARQARPYALLQFFILATLLFFLLFLKNRKPVFFIGLIFSAVLAFLTHPLALVILAGLVVYIIVEFISKMSSSRKRGSSLLKIPAFLRLRSGQIGGMTKKWLGIILTVLITFCLLLFAFLFSNLFDAIKNQIIFPYDQRFHFYNHFWYYHSLFWRQYSFVTFGAILGIIIGLFRNSRKTILLSLILLILFSFISFRFPQHFLRYPFVVFPLVLILFSYFLVWFTENLSGQKKALGWFLILILPVFIVVNGFKFNLIPKPFYSLNLDFREVPEPDFKTIHLLVKEKMSKDTVIITNRPDASEWYLGEGKTSYYLVGQEQSVLYNLSRGKLTDDVSGAKYLLNLDDLKKIVLENKQGFVILEEAQAEFSNLDPNTKQFLDQNLQKEMRIEALKENPNSVWPITLYSWEF